MPVQISHRLAVERHHAVRAAPSARARGTAPRSSRSSRRGRGWRARASGVPARAARSVRASPASLRVLGLERARCRRGAPSALVPARPRARRGPAWRPRRGRRPPPRRWGPGPPAFTPGTAFALGRRRRSSRVAPNTGGRATTAVSRPGSVTSMPNCASPVTFSRLSRRRVGLPMSFHSVGSLSGGSAGTGMRARPLGELAVGERAGRPAEHGAVLRAQARAVDLPRVRRGREQHLARGRAGLAEALELARDARRCRRSSACRRRDARRPASTGAASTLTRAVDLELLGDQHRERRSRCPGPSRIVHEDGDRVVAADAEERVRREVAGGRAAGRLGAAASARAGSRKPSRMPLDRVADGFEERRGAGRGVAIVRPPSASARRPA